MPPRRVASKRTRWGAGEHACDDYEAVGFTDEAKGAAGLHAALSRSGVDMAGMLAPVKLQDAFALSAWSLVSRSIARSARLRAGRGREQSPLAGDALQRVRASVLELDA
jgi:hypothetical protein